MKTTGGILSAIKDRDPLLFSRDMEGETITEKELYDSMKGIFKPSYLPRAMYLTEISVCIRKDKIGLCADGFTDNWRTQTEEEKKYIDNFLSKF